MKSTMKTGPLLKILGMTDLVRDVSKVRELPSRAVARSSRKRLREELAGENMLETTEDITEDSRIKDAETQTTLSGDILESNYEHTKHVEKELQELQMKVEQLAYMAHMEVHITSSKTDQYRQGDSVVVARTGSATCPVALLERYYGMTAITRESRLKLFRSITATKSGERSQGGLSYTRLRELFLRKLTSLGFDAKQFGLHSLRAGGATAAAQAGIPDRLFKRHGRWRSESAKDGYIKDSMSSLLSVSQSLKL